MNGGLFHAFGLFWKLNEINWKPGSGARGEFRLLGRQGFNKGSLKLADFRRQNGIYILYGNYGAHYVGLTRAQGFGKRLKDHLSDGHANEWDRFSWFSFGRVLKRRTQDGLCQFAAMPAYRAVHPRSMIGDIEALLIKAMALENNKAKMKFAHATQWHQVNREEVDLLLRRASK